MYNCCCFSLILQTNTNETFLLSFKNQSPVHFLVFISALILLVRSFNSPIFASYFSFVSTAFFISVSSFLSLPISSSKLFSADSKDSSFFSNFTSSSFFDFTTSSLFFAWSFLIL
eukprot:UN26147